MRVKTFSCAMSDMRARGGHSAPRRNLFWLLTSLVVSFVERGISVLDEPLGLVTRRKRKWESLDGKI